MYSKDKNHRITLRLNEDQFGYVANNSEVLGVSPSDYLRMLVNSFMAASKLAEKATLQKLNEEQENAGGGAGRENDKADINDIV